MQWVIGVDEAGRGPLAGPISVGAALIPLEMNDWKYWNGLKDSKQLSEKRREAWFARFRTSDVLHAVALVSAQVIDARGVTYAASLAVARAIERLDIRPAEVRVLLDGGLSAPDPWKQQRFVKGDENIPAIALASIVAKVTRDRHMARMAKKFPLYGFEQHKGYGTSLHYERLEAHGPCALHRRTFLHT